MGKIRIKTLGDEELEKEQKNQSKKRKEAKKLVKGAHGGERVVAVGPTEEELVKLEEAKETKEPKDTKETKKKGTQKKAAPKKVRSKTYQAVAKMVDKNKQYSLTEAVSLLPKLKRAKFDETVELHINTVEAGISGSFTLPHGTGKQVKIAIASDELLKEIEKGKINFDVLIATPEMMPKLAKVAKVLGPRGLMPNPKNGTITTKPEEEVKKYQGGHTSFKTESKLPIIHLTVGKLSFGPDKLTENITTAIKGVNTSRIKKITLKSTMSPGIKIQY